MANSKVKIDVGINVNGLRNSGKTFILNKIRKLLESEGYSVKDIETDILSTAYTEGIIVYKELENGELQS